MELNHKAVEVVGAVGAMRASVLQARLTAMLGDRTGDFTYPSRKHVGSEISQGDLELLGVALKENLHRDGCVQRDGDVGRRHGGQRGRLTV